MGARRCSIDGCKSVAGRPQHRGVTYHTIPTNPLARACWMSNSRMAPTKSITKSVLICSRHFRRADFQPLKNNKYLLKIGAVPTIFPWGSMPYVEPAKVKIDSEIGSSEASGSGVAEQVVDSGVSAVIAPVVDTKEAFPLIKVPTVEATVNEEKIVKQISVDAIKTEMKSPIKRSASTSKIPANDSEEPSAKLARKSLDSAFSKAKEADAAIKEVAATVKEILPQTLSSTADPVTIFIPGSQIEAQDFNEVWHPATVMEVDMDEREVLIHFEINNAKPIIDEWIPMNSSRLRQLQNKGATPGKTNPKRPIPTFTLGEQCRAKWTDSRKWKATVTEVLDNDNYIVLFDDGYSRKCSARGMSKIKPPPTILQPSDSPAVIVPIVSTPIKTSPQVLPQSAPQVALAKSASKAKASSAKSTSKTTPTPAKTAAKPNANAVKSASKSKPNTASAKTATTVRKINPPLPIPKFDLTKLNLLPVPVDGEWCCNWVNDTPIGTEGYLEGPDGNRRPTVLVDDWRLPPSWTKHLYQRSSVSGKWDVVLVGPSGKRFRSKNDVKVFLEERGGVYNPDIYDFSIHKRRAKDTGLYIMTDDYKELLKQKQIQVEAEKAAAAAAAAVLPSISVPTTPISTSPIMSNISTEDLFTGFSPEDQGLAEKILIVPQLSVSAAITSTPIRASAAPTAPPAAPVHIAQPAPTLPQLEEGFVHVGALKVQLIDNLFRCPDETCNKNFRKENHLQIHIKHYHEDLAKLMGVCPNMSELAYLRTMGQPEESLPKNQIPNVQFFEKVFQSDISSKALRKSMSSPTGSIKMELPKIEQPQPGPSTSSLPADILLKNMDLLEDAFMNKESSFEQSLIVQDCIGGFVKPPASLSKIDGHMDYEGTFEAANILAHTAVPPAAFPAKPPRPRKPANRSNKSRVKKRRPKPVRAKAANRSAPVLLSALNQSITDFEENARHSFSDIVTPMKTGRLKQVQQQSVDSIQMSVTDSLVPVSDVFSGNATSSPGFISENGEMIKIVSMRQEEIINCLCSYGEEDGLMIQCELCLCWQHGVCNGIEKESEVPEKYVCYICKNPQRGRESMKYVHDQDWLYDGRLPMASFHRPSPKHAERFDMLKQSHQLTGNLLELKKFMHSLKVKINIAENKDHPKMYLWSKKWERSSPSASQNHQSHTVSGIESLSTAHMNAPDPRKLTDSDLNIILNEDQKNIDTIKTEITSEICIEPPVVSQTPITDGVEVKDESMRTDNIMLNEESKPNVDDPAKTTLSNYVDSSILTDLLTSPGGTSIDLVDACKQEQITPTNSRKLQQRSAMNAPQPEAAIDSAECQLRLLEHIQKQQTMAMTRLQTIEAQIIGLEAMDEKAEELEPNDSFLRTKQTIDMLLNDLNKMRKLASINLAMQDGDKL